MCRDLRMGWCLKIAAGGEPLGAVKEAGVWQRYSGLVPCGWQSCPNCGPRKAIGNLERARAIADRAVKDGYLLMMCSFTMRHQVGESLCDLRVAFKEAQRSMHRGRPWRTFAERYGVKRLFYGFEVTDGAHGWHFHNHPVYAVRKPDWVRNSRTKRAFAKQLEVEVFALHQAALKRFGRDADEQHGARVTLAAGDVETPEKAARYATKFALEAISYVSKDGRRGNKTAWQLLDDAGDTTLAKPVRDRAKERYREFVEATRGMHWTQFVDEEGEEDAAGDVPEVEAGEGAEPAEGTADFFPLTQWEWRCLVYLERELWLLELLDERGPPGARVEMARLCDPQRWTATFRRAG